MSLYILVEGRRTEKIIYPSWISQSTGLIQKKTVEAPNDNEFYIISGMGYPCVVTDHLDNAIKEVNEYGYTNFWVIVDADDEDVELRREHIQCRINRHQMTAQVDIIIQDVCIETFGLANNRFFPIELTDNLSNFKNRYDVTTLDPALYLAGNGSHKINTAKLHEKYLKEVFVANKVHYSKKRPGKFKELDFFNGIKERYESTGHVSSFNEILMAMDKL